MENDSENPNPRSSSSVGQSRVLRLKEVCRVTGLGRSFIYQLQAQGQFPHSIRLGVRAVGWLEKDVQHWVDGRVMFSSAEGARK
jgi:prophage regulatory protein